MMSSKKQIFIENSIHNLVKLGLREHASIQLGGSNIHFTQLRPSWRSQVIILTWFSKPGKTKTMYIDF